MLPCIYLPTGLNHFSEVITVKLCSKIIHNMLFWQSQAAQGKEQHWPLLSQAFEVCLTSARFKAAGLKSFSSVFFELKKYRAPETPRLEQWKQITTVLGKTQGVPACFFQEYVVSPLIKSHYISPSASFLGSIVFPHASDLVQKTRAVNRWTFL